MKKITALLAALLILSTATFATDITPSEKLQKEFNRSFGESTEVKWEKVSDYYKVSFLQDGQYLIAYFDAFNNVVSVSRNITVNALPLMLKKSMDDVTSETTWITDCIELLGENGTEYYVALENADQKTIYHANGNSWEVYKRMDK